MKKLRYAVLGCGFWSKFQINGWKELENLELVAVYNRTLSKAQERAKEFGVPAFYDNVQDLFDKEKIDFVDIITDVDTHAVFTEMAAKKGISVVCQKPMAPNFSIAKQMLETCNKYKVSFYINENFRWQAPIRKFKQIMDSGIIGTIFKARVSFCSGFPVFENQPFLAELEQFILTDIGSHVLDISRFLFGEAETLYCQIKRVNPKIKGEDVANVFMKMKNGIHCYTEMSYASILEKEVFPQTLVLAEGDKGSIYLDANFELKVTTRQGSNKEFVKPKMYPWLDPAYAVVHSSIVDAQRDILRGLQGGKSEITGFDNFETVKLVFASYESAKTGKIIEISNFK